MRDAVRSLFLQKVALPGCLFASTERSGASAEFENCRVLSLQGQLRNHLHNSTSAFYNYHTSLVMCSVCVTNQIQQLGVHNGRCLPVLSQRANSVTGVVLVLVLPGVMSDICKSYGGVLCQSRKGKLAESKTGQQWASPRLLDNYHMAGGGLLAGVVMHLLHQIIGDDHYLLLCWPAMGQQL